MSTAKTRVDMNRCRRCQSYEESYMYLDTDSYDIWLVLECKCRRHRYLLRDLDRDPEIDDIPIIIYEGYPAQRSGLIVAKVSRSV